MYARNLTSYVGAGSLLVYMYKCVGCYDVIGTIVTSWRIIMSYPRMLYIIIACAVYAFYIFYQYEYVSILSNPIKHVVCVLTFIITCAVYQL